MRDAFRAQGTKVKFDYAVISNARTCAKTINPSDADLQDFLQAKCQAKLRDRRARGAEDSVRRPSTAANLPGGKPPVTDADLQAYYNAAPGAVSR